LRISLGRRRDPRSITFRAAEWGNELPGDRHGCRGPSDGGGHRDNHVAAVSGAVERTVERGVGMPARRRGRPRLSQRHAVPRRRAACRGRRRVAPTVPAHRTGGGIGPTRRSGGHDRPPRTVRGSGVSTSGGARLVRRAWVAARRPTVEIYGPHRVDPAELTTEIYYLLS